MILAVVFPIKSAGLEMPLFTIGDVEITNVMLLAIFFIFTLIFTLYLSFCLFARPDRVDIDKRNRRVLQVLIFLTGLTVRAHSKNELRVHIEKLKWYRGYSALGGESYVSCEDN